MEVSLDAPYASVCLLQGDLDYGEHHKGTSARDEQLRLLPKSQKIVHLAADAKSELPEV